MKKVVVAIAWVCFASGAGFSALPSQSSNAVPASEVEHLMGSCAAQGIVAQDVCSSICGFARVQSFINGSNKIDDAEPCGAVRTCTAPRDITNNACAG